MIEQIIDFGNFSKRILINPIVPMQIINIKCRNGQRAQATLLGKVYSSSIEILQAIPVGLCDLNQLNKVKTIDFQEHQKSLENIMTVYPTLQVIGVAVTDLKPDINLAILHTMYANKESGFKAQGILTYPIILSVGTELNERSDQIPIQAYCFNQTYKFCKEIMEITAFEKLSAQISLGDADFESVAPLFEALNDQQKIVPEGNADSILRELISRLKELKATCDKEEHSAAKIKLRSIVDRLNSKHEYSMEQLSYLLDLTGLQKRIALKLNKFQ